MRFQNSPLYQNIKNSPLLKMFLVFFGVLIVLAIIVSLTSGNNKKTTTTNEYFDAGSGETVSDPKGKAVENYGQTTQYATTLLGFSKLIDKGMATGQLKEINAQLQLFSSKQNPKITELSLATNSIVLTTPPEGQYTTTVTGELTANRKDKYALELSYDRITTIRMVIKKADAVLYDSGVIDYYNIEHADD